MVPLPCSFSPILDTCGTGGDHSGTFNISTAVSLVLAGAGVKVVKHGNRSASSKSGSADLLASLGVPIEGGVDWAAQTLADVGYAFCFAPLFHPTLKYVAPLRREMGIRTIFNLLGPLLNPTKASHQLLGVARAELLPVLSQAVQKLGQTTAFLVRSHDGLDEVSLAAPTEVISIRNGRSETFTWTPDDFGLAATPLESIQVNSPAESAAFVQSILQGVPGPGRRVVVANAAAGLLLIERVKSLREGVEIAEHSLDSGESLRVLQRLQRAKR
jgi:anthranilate phosphoribosyltransferase